MRKPKFQRPPDEDEGARQPWHAPFDWTPGRELTAEDEDRLSLEFGLGRNDAPALSATVLPRDPWSGTAAEVLDAISVLSRTNLQKVLKEFISSRRRDARRRPTPEKADLEQVLGEINQLSQALERLEMLTPRQMLAMTCAVRAVDAGIDVSSLLRAELGAGAIFSTAADRRRGAVGAAPRAFNPKRNDDLIRITRETPAALNSFAFRRAFFEALWFWNPDKSKALVLALLARRQHTARDSELIKVYRAVEAGVEQGSTRKQMFERIALDRGPMTTAAEIRGKYEDARRLMGHRTKAGITRRK
jgi:hypothetical protein